MLDHDDTHPWFSFKCRPYAFVPGRTRIEIDQGPECVVFDPSGAILRHPDVERTNAGVHVGMDAREALYTVISDFLQGKEMEVTVAWSSRDVHRITTAGVTRIRSIDHEVAADRCPTGSSRA
jgi:hypothetical protein